MGYRTTAHDELLEAEDDDDLCDCAACRAAEQAPPIQDSFPPYPSRTERCGDCMCCTEEQCGSLTDNECPTNTLGESTCPCTCD